MSDHPVSEALRPPETQIEAGIWIKKKSLQHGFTQCGITSPDIPIRQKRRYQEVVAQGQVGDMLWLAQNQDRRENPTHMWPDLKSIICLAFPYTPPHDPLKALNFPEKGSVSAYAQGKDYHDIIKKALKAIAREFMQLPYVSAREGAVKVFVDTAPILEKPLAQQAGLGWQGKHTNLVSRTEGSWFFLAEIFTNLELPYDSVETDHCGSCQSCYDICPTQAFPAPYQLNPTRCLAYLTIEHKGVIAEEFRRPMGNRIYGCDDCLAICPWNKFADASVHEGLWPRIETSLPDLEDLLCLDDAGFRQVFSGSPIKRIGSIRFRRNILIAMGNSGQQRYIPLISTFLIHSAPLLRGMSIWALSQLMGKAEFVARYGIYQIIESDADVMAEWHLVR